MSTLTLLQKGLKRKLSLLLNQGATVFDLQLGLYVNNHTPSPDDTESAYTECTLPGYAEIDLVGSTWSGPTYTSPVAASVYATATFTFTGGGQTIYGVILYDHTGEGVAAGLLDTPFTVPTGGGSVTITNLTMQDKNC